MKVLLITKKPISPPSDGETIAIDSIYTGLKNAGVEVHVLSIETQKHRIKNKEFYTAIENGSTYINTKPTIKGFLQSLFSGGSYNVDRFYTKSFATLIQDRLEDVNFDIIQFEGIHLQPYLKRVRKITSATCILRSHNVEGEIWLRLALNKPKGPIRWIYKFLAKRLLKFERKAILDFDGIASISPRDSEYFLECNPRLKILNLPTGISSNHVTPVHHSSVTKEIDLFGALDWIPNQEGLHWFLNQVWPLIIEKEPSAILNIAGRNAPDTISKIALPRVNFMGEVPSSTAFLKRNSILVVPLLSGSGIRIKILEALALGKPIVSTPIGAEGIHVEHGKHILLAKKREDFAHAVIELMRDNELVNTVSGNGPIFIREEFENSKIIQNLIKFYKTFPR